MGTFNDPCIVWPKPALPIGTGVFTRLDDVDHGQILAVGHSWDFNVHLGTYI
jgi:hypothetical protein